MTAFLPLILALAAFVGWHFMIPILRVRGKALLGERGYHMGFGLVSLALFGAALVALVTGPEIMLWTPPIYMRHLALLLVPIGLILVVMGFWHPNPYSMGRSKGFNPQYPGIVRYIRHPVLLGLAIWAVAHILANGDVGSVIFFGSALVLVVFGVWRNRQPMPKMGPLTSDRLSPPLVVGFGLVVLMLLIHEPLFGVAVLG